MRLSASPSPFAASHPAASARARRREPAFTMIEIALSLAIIGFALVAIIGALPKGMNVQRENREETIINQDAASVYRYMNFDQIEEYADAAKAVAV